MSRNKPNHRIREIFYELVGETFHLKNLFINTYGIPKDRVNDYFIGRKKVLEAADAAYFLEFFNAHKHPNANTYVLSDLYKEDLSNNVINNLNLSK
jgi:hypothetical protein